MRARGPKRGLDSTSLVIHLFFALLLVGLLLALHAWSDLTISEAWPWIAGGLVAGGAVAAAFGHPTRHRWGLAILAAWIWPAFLVDAGPTAAYGLAFMLGLIAARASVFPPERALLSDSAGSRKQG